MLCRDATLPCDTAEDLPEEAILHSATWEQDLSPQVKRRLQMLRLMEEVVAPKVKVNIECAQAAQKRNYDARRNL